MKKHTLQEDLDKENKYEFVMCSPSYEIFKRMHAILSNIPEVVKNIEEEENASTERLIAQHKLLYKNHHGNSNNVSLHIDDQMEDQSAVNEYGQKYEAYNKFYRLDSIRNKAFKMVKKWPSLMLRPLMGTQ